MKKSEVAGRKRINAGGIPDRVFSAGEREKGDTVRSIDIFSLQTRRLQIDGKHAVSRGSLITSFKA